MGSGCKTPNTNLPADVIPDRKVKYTGPDFPTLGICTGDRLHELETIILQKLVDYSTAKGITIEGLDFDDCDILQDFIKCCAIDNTLIGLIQGILNTFCTIDAKFGPIQDQIDKIIQDTTYVIDPGCLTVSNTRIDNVLNKLIAEFCKFWNQMKLIFGPDLDSPVLNNVLTDKITTDVINAVFGNLKSCAPTDIVKTGSGINTILTFKGQVPIGTILFGIWPVGYFDNSGLGLEANGMCGWAICNGANGTLDMRGFTAAMATNIPGPAPLHPQVDPVLNNDADWGTSIGDVRGYPKWALRPIQCAVPVHKHGIVDKKHSHTVLGIYHNNVRPGNGNTDDLPKDNPGQGSYITDEKFTGITETMDAGGTGTAQQAHENRQPTKYINCIQRIA